MMLNGITAGGNWIIDLIKFVDCYPEQGHLANIIRTEPPTNGGCPFNVLLDIARIEPSLPLQGVGVIGKDEFGKFIIDTCKKNNIDTELIRSTTEQPTSYTDVITVESSGHRTFFHARGANSILDVDDFKISKISGKICLLGYLLLLDKLDRPDKEFGTRAARLLCMLKEAGIETAVDVVSENSERFCRIVTPALKFTDYLILNEIEAGKILNRRLRKDGAISADETLSSAKALLDLGVNKKVIIHFPEGASAAWREGTKIYSETIKSLKLPSGFIKGTVGAGDAFCAGALCMIYEGKDMRETLEFAAGAAAASLSHPTASQGIESKNQILDIIERYGR